MSIAVTSSIVFPLNMTLSNALLLENAELPIDVTVDGIETTDSPFGAFPPYTNALFPMVYNPSGRSYLPVFCTPANPYGPIAVSESPANVMLDMLTSRLNALSSTISTFSPITMPLR